MRGIFGLCAFLYSVCLLPAEEHLSFAEMIGMDLETAFQRCGIPQEVFPIRGSEPAQDDVAFYYPGGFYLYWFQNRVWQVRLDHRFPESFLMLRMGASRADVLKRMGPPFKETDEALVYQLEDRGYPIWVRFSFNSDILSGFFCYRGDL